MIFGCWISFIMATSLSMLIGIFRIPSLESGREASARSRSARLPACDIFACLFCTILTAAACPVASCLANRTRAVAPSPKVFPSLQGPTCSLITLPLEAVDTTEALLEDDVSCSLEIAESRGLAGLIRNESGNAVLSKSERRCGDGGRYTFMREMSGLFGGSRGGSRSSLLTR